MRESEAITILVIGVIIAVSALAGMLYPLVQKVTNFLVF
jgi:hypothetical protein